MNSTLCLVKSDLSGCIFLTFRAKESWGQPSTGLMDVSPLFQNFVWWYFRRVESINTDSKPVLIYLTSKWNNFIYTPQHQHLKTPQTPHSYLLVLILGIEVNSLDILTTKASAHYLLQASVCLYFIYLVTNKKILRSIHLYFQQFHYKTVESYQNYSYFTNVLNKKDLQTI